MSVVIARSPRQFGTLQGLKVIILYLFGKKKVYANLRSLNKKITMRPGTEDQYIIDKFTAEKKWEIQKEKVNCIIDAGAHIGIASVMFADMYPEAKIIAIEPEKSNYNILKSNTKNLNNVETYRSAIWYENGQLGLNKKGENWSHTVSSTNVRNKKVKSKTLEKIIEKNNIKKIDILKMDIEGGEREVLDREDGWSGIVDCLIVEEHERMKKGSIKAIKSFAERNGMKLKKKGEEYILHRENVKIVDI